MSKKELLAGVASASALLATAASAADLASVAHNDAAASADDWSGTYAGVMLSYFSGDAPVTADGGDYNYSISGSTGGVFVGFNNQLDNSGLVVGAEVALQSGGGIVSDCVDGTDYCEDYGLNWIVDTKLRVGVAMGNILAYASGGMSFESANGNGGDTAYSAYGINLGVGLDAKIADNFILGVEFTDRMMQGVDAAGEEGPDTNHYSVALRAAYSF